MSVDAAGVYVVGNTSGTLPGQTSAGDSDVFVVKIEDSPPNSPPTANAGGPYPVAEGGSVTLNGSDSDPTPATR